MGKIHLLSPDIISKIAAGEVIERPASVIKELIENSLDAGATDIELHLKEAGKTLIRLKDNGSGIEPDDLEKIFLRHSTSKIKDIEDLFNIHSLGFRGEALYSIGAVADVTLKSKTNGQDNGWQIHMRGGQQSQLKPVVMGQGTDIEVKELFFNTPARKKFLKTNSTEINQILNIFLPYTLLYPQCRFLLSHQDKTLIDLRLSKQLKDRIAQSLNLETKHLLEAQKNFSEEKISIHMVLGDINIQRAQRDMQFLFINDRPVQNRAILLRMNQLYRALLAPDVFAFFSLSIEIPPEDVDVNMHPTKKEVKIKSETEIINLISALAQETLLSCSKAKQVSLPISKKEEQVVNNDLSSPVIREKQSAQSSSSVSSIKNLKSDPAESIEPFGKYAAQHYAFQNPPVKEGQTANFLTEEENTLNYKLAIARYIGTFMKKFLIFETGTSLLVVDQHAAQERIAYEGFIKQMSLGKIEVQSLLSPFLLKLSKQELLSWEENKTKLEEIGISTNLWDKETLAIHSYPHLLKKPEIATRYLLSGETITYCDHETIARRACRSSVMAGDAMGPSQVEYQRQQLLKCQDPFTCPHGRPTVIEMTENFLDKQFLRK